MTDNGVFLNYSNGHACRRNLACTHLPLDSSVLSTRSMPIGGNLPVPVKKIKDRQIFLYYLSNVLLEQSNNASDTRIRLMSWLEKSGLD